MITSKGVNLIIKKQGDLSTLLLAHIKMHGKDLLEGMTEEHRFHPIRRWRFDLAWVASKIAVECDGGQFKALGGRHNSDGDREKLNTACLNGWLVLRFSSTQIKNDPIGCINFIREAIKNNG